VVGLFYLAPVLRLLPALTEPGMRKVLYALCAFYLLEWLHVVLQFEAVLKRELFAFIILLALVVFAWLTRPSRLNMQRVPKWRRRALFAGISVGLFLLAGSLLANVLGFVSLSQILGLGTLFSAFTFALLYTVVRVLHLGISMVVSSAWFRSLPDAPGDVIERWGQRLFVILALILWVNVDLYLFTVRGSVVEALRGALQYPISFGKFHITLGGTLGLVLLLFLGYIIANIASFVLGQMLLPKLSLRPGMAYAISRVTYYVLLVGLFFAGLTNAGLELDKFTIITGALGLGVGFGLQNIVNNFASGLIILFERPIRIGDTVEVSGVVGTVRHIGARSSTVLTFQGAEVILPNSTLLSNQVANWTLSSARRRVEIPVGISYGTDPQLALRLLTEIATSNPQVLHYPQPEALFLGFGESALNFELRFWAAQSTWFELKSQIGLAILQSFRQAGIDIPYPQRDLHVRSVESPIKEDVSTSNKAIDRMAAKS
jgi:potassium efflux system protein